MTKKNHRNMKKIIFTLLLILMGSGILFAQSNFHNNHYIDPYNPEYVKGEVLIKFKDEVEVKSSFKSGIALTGVNSVDDILQSYQLEAITKLFKETREQRQRKTVKYIRDFKGKEIEVPALFNIYKLKFDTIWDAKQIIEELQKDNNIVYAEPNYLVYTNEVIENGRVPNNPPKQTPLPSITGERDPFPNDPLYQNGSQNYLDAMNLPLVWDTITGDSTQVIAILDTGVDWTHPDLADNIWNNQNEIAGNTNDDDGNGFQDDTRGWDFVNNDNNPMDDNSHGTHVAGIAAARGNNGIGIAGINWYAKIMSIKVFTNNGVGEAATIVQGINYAADNGATILNMSFCGYGRSFTMENALINAYLTADLVAAAGNDAKSIYSLDPFNPTTAYPAALPYVIGVQALAEFSNYDPDGPIHSTFEEGFNYELTAPGGALSTSFNGTYIFMQGTSMAAPMISGSVSLYRAHFPNVSKEKLWGDFIYSSPNMIDVYNAFNPIDIHPILDVSDYSIMDDLPGDDQDGHADAGETVGLFITARNTWGNADSVYALISHSIYSDPNDVSFTNDSVYLGSISTYGTLTNSTDPFLINISQDCFNNRNVTVDITLKNAGDTLSFTQGVDFIIYNGEELSGILTTDTILTTGKLWLINNNLRISSGVTLTILPGTHVELYAGIDNRGFIHAEGTADSMIYITGGGFNGNGLFKYINFDLNVSDMSVNTNIERCNILNGGKIEANKIINSTFRNCGTIWIKYFSFGNTDSIISTNVYNSCADELGRGFFDQCLFDNVVCGQGSNSSQFTNCVFNDFTNIYVYLYPNSPNLWSPNFLIQSNYDLHNRNSFLNNNIEYYFVKTSGQDNYQNLPNQYWGTNNETRIREKYYDFMQDVTLPYLVVDPILTVPSDSCPGHVWKVLVNGIDSQDEIVDPVGVGIQKFEVFFNRAMDTTFSPTVTFGLRFPFIQNVVNDSTSWSSDKKTWTGYFNLGLYTGDGIHTIRVADAKDSIGNKIPVEDDRFTFVVQAAGVQSLNFMATPGIGKVEMEWNNTGLEDFLGFNMYRYMNITDTTFSEPATVNETLITDTIFIDYNVIPDTTYHYYYKIVNTDLHESDSSNIVTATPFDAANGDANGDLAVNVLDITTIVSYMLNQNPSPFLFDAADVNYDDNINVLDIIGLVQLINSKKSATTQPLPEVSNDIAYYQMFENTLSLETKGNIAALQFRLKATMPDSRQESQKPTALDKVKIFSLVQGFEFAYAVVDNEIIGILYSLSEREIPEGISELFRFEGVDIDDLQITDIFGGDLNGDYVPVLKKGESNLLSIDDAELIVSPNPFTNTTTINYSVPENGIVSLKVYNLNGSEVIPVASSYRNAGYYSINWDGVNKQGQKLKSGIYLLQMKIESVSGNDYSKEVKIVLTR